MGTNNKICLLCVTPLLLTVALVCVYFSGGEQTIMKNYAKYTKPIVCERELVKISLKHAALLIDEELLAAIAQEKCDEVQKATQIKVAYPKDIIDLNGFENSTLHDERLNVHSYRLEKNYMRIGDDRVVPRIEWTLLANNLLVPSDPLLFRKMLQRSKEIKCLGLTDRTKKHRRLNHVMSMMVLIRDMLLTKSAFAYLEAGTLLGWYRGCELIPHTGDADLGVLKEEYNDEIETMFLRPNQSLWVVWLLGKIEHSRELKLAYENIPWETDLFVVYSNASYSWTAVSFWETKINLIPRYEPNCAGIFNDHIFWVTCNVEDSLLAGAKWRTPNGRWDSYRHPTNYQLIDKVAYKKRFNRTSS